MAYRQKSLPHVLAAMATTAFVLMVCLLAVSPVASARVTIVPGTAQGGDTETFAVRLANERPDTSTTWLELTFPADAPIPLVEVAPAQGWTSTVTMRPLDPPVTVGDRVFNEAVASIVWEGGRIAPGHFEQFLVTVNPLPPTGPLVFGVTQGYRDGTVDRWTDPAPNQDDPGAPTIDLVPLTPAAPPTDSAEAPSAAPAPEEQATSEGSNPLLWVLVVGSGLLVAAAVVGYRIRGRTPTPTGEQADAAAEAAPEEARSK